ncbi:hypothetical protein jaqu_11950 [Jannaschia aquimarina]|uniref:Exopolysaccharide biosynthesis protein YbjH n=2 Tax=Jannaschia aquimarina TaxID=935700 RepID=A0A0D1EMT6_9RHOB|nr:hypothetical protein jaqu_11950 [Jannaschia aquimarina]SNS81301.1 Exopolysaccharide biosynthesis protein YbjH [Jannaschia aquimarina]
MGAKRYLPGTAAALAVMLSGHSAVPQQNQRPVTTNFLGVPGLIDTPSAEMQPDGTLTTSVHAFDNGTTRTALTFQIAPRVQGVFRYATIDDLLIVNGERERTYDRSFDLRLQLLKETARRPAVTVGLQDFGGTGIYSSEYIVATKTLGDFTVSGGIGWGRLGTENGFSNPFGLGDRPEFEGGTGGDFEADQWFRGDAALFGGVAWRATDKLTFKAEYSSDAYEQEVEAGIVDRKTSVNLGLDYEYSPRLRLQAAYRFGSDIGIGLVYALNPKQAPAGGGTDVVPEPVLVRPSRNVAPELWLTEWLTNPRSGPVIEDSLTRALEAAGLELHSYRVSADEAQIRFFNPTYESQAQAIGRAARAATRSLPASVETLVLVPLNSRSQPGAAVVLRRSDVEAIENRPDGADEILAVAGIVDAQTLSREGLVLAPGAYPRFDWGLGPYVSISTFDPDNPLRIDLGAQLSARFEPTPGLVFSGAIRQRLIGNRDESTRESNSVLPRVRSESNLFAKTDEPFIPYLTAEYFFRPGRNLYGRLSAGLLERQFGGVSAELLWKPATGPLALGVEVNHVRQRDFDMRFGFQDLDATTGYVSAYYNHGGGYHSTLHVGQYLAGDQGATYELSRRFANGWELGAYATKTNVSSEEFGEGSFDKGIKITIPTSFLTGQPSRGERNTVIQPILRDGGARLRLQNRLYGLVSDQSGPELTEDWGRFWR